MDAAALTNAELGNMTLPAGNMNHAAPSQHITHRSNTPANPLPITSLHRIATTRLANILDPRSDEYRDLIDSVYDTKVSRSLICRNAPCTSLLSLLSSLLHQEQLFLDH